MFVDKGTPIKNSANGSGGFTVGNTVSTLSGELEPPIGANKAIMQFVPSSGASFSDTNKIIRVRIDDADPTAAIGFVFGDREYFVLESRAAINQCRLISTDSGSNTVDVWVQYIED